MRPWGRASRGRLVVALAAGIAATWALAVADAPGRSPHAGDGTGGVRKHRVATLNSPIFATRAPGQPKKLYVVERAGTVRVLGGGQVRRHKFLNIRGRVNTVGERGLLSIAFDPRYRHNGLVYAYYNNNSGDIEIDQFRAHSNKRVSRRSRRKVIEIPHPGASNHNGGTIMFGPSGYLFAATGDGGTGGANSQDRSSLLGKVLRINPHHQPHKPYTVPGSNPFVGRPGRKEIFSMGLRNPFRFSFNGSRLAIGDVGENSQEEVDYETKRGARGANFGWPRFEGRHHISGPKPAHYQRPIFSYAHTGPNCESQGGCAITGGLVVHGAGLPSLRGRYLYADFFKGALRSFVPHLKGARRDRRLGVHVAEPVDFARGPHGNIYVVSLAGPVYRLVHG